MIMTIFYCYKILDEISLANTYNYRDDELLELGKKYFMDIESFLHKSINHSKGYFLFDHY